MKPDEANKITWRDYLLMQTAFLEKEQEHWKRTRVIAFIGYKAAGGPLRVEEFFPLSSDKHGVSENEEAEFLQKYLELQKTFKIPEHD